MEIRIGFRVGLSMGCRVDFGGELILGFILLGLYTSPGSYGVSQTYTDVFILAG